MVTLECSLDAPVNRPQAACQELLDTSKRLNVGLACEYPKGKYPLLAWPHDTLDSVMERYLDMRKRVDQLKDMEVRQPDGKRGN